MTVTIELSDEQAAALQAQAAEEGMTVDAWLQRLAEQHAESMASLPAKVLDERPIWEVITGGHCRHNEDASGRSI